MARAFLATGGAIHDTVRRVVIALPDSDQDWLWRAVYGMLVYGAEPATWESTGTTTADEAAAAFDRIVESWTPLLPQIGMIFDYPSAVAPFNCLPCDGATHLRADYPDLYGALASAFIVDADHFITPDLRGRVRRTIQLGEGVGDVYGADSIALTVGELPAHSHSISGYIPGVAVTPGELPVLTDVTVPSNTGDTGSGDSIDIRPKAMVVGTYIVAKFP